MTHLSSALGVSEASLFTHLRGRGILRSSGARVPHSRSPHMDGGCPSRRRAGLGKVYREYSDRGTMSRGQREEEGALAEEERTTLEEARRVGDEIGVDWDRFKLEQFRIGMDVEYEHGAHDPQTDVTGDDSIHTSATTETYTLSLPDAH